MQARRLALLATLAACSFGFAACDEGAREQPNEGGALWHEFCASFGVPASPCPSIVVEPRIEVASSESARGLEVLQQLGAFPFMGSGPPDRAVVPAVYSPEHRVIRCSAALWQSVLGGNRHSESILIHELCHAHRDRVSDLTRYIASARTLDELLARRAVVEGEAIVVQQKWSPQDLAPAIRFGFGNALWRFQYEKGAEFVRTFVRERPIEELFVRPPESTEQVLHLQKYLARDPPLDLMLPPKLGSAWRAHASETLGEWCIRSFLEAHGEVDASAAARGWRGDRCWLLRNESGDLVVWHTAWDSTDDAREFLDVLRRAMGWKFHRATETPDGWHWPAGRAARIGQRDAHVLFVDGSKASAVTTAWRSFSEFLVEGH